MHRRFRLNRLADPTGVSGTGVVAEGVQFSDGTVALCWVGVLPSVVVREPRYEGQDVMAAVRQVHGHRGQTVIEWIDGE